MSGLVDKVAIVTGGTRGVGAAIAAALLARGADVVITGRTAESASRGAERLAAVEPVEGVARRGRVLGIACDVRDYDACRELIQRTVAEFGRLDVLVNNAGIGIFAPADKLGVEDWRAVLETNLSGVFYCSREAIPHLRETGGWIINIGSLAGKNAFAGGAAYNASKFGLIGFSEALMQDVRHDGIRVSYIMPGSIATEFGGRDQDAGRDWKLWPEDVAQAVVDLLAYPGRALPSRIELRPSRPAR
ncbi:MAG TPA: SDR family oxidoreductase [Longimicrobiales bacterium]|nr:SDR family oxidoreductase [Longimicrobiales bacterium]